MHRIRNVHLCPHCCIWPKLRCTPKNPKVSFSKISVADQPRKTPEVKTRILKLKNAEGVDMPDPKTLFESLVLQVL